MSSDVEKLRAARELIARPGGWTQNAYNGRSQPEVISAFDRAIALAEADHV